MSSSPLFGLGVTGPSAGPCSRDPKNPHFAPAAGFCLSWGWNSPLPPSASSLLVGSPPSGAPRGLQDKPRPSSEWPGPLCPVPPPTPAPRTLRPSAACAAHAVPRYTSRSLCRDTSLLFSGGGDADPPFGSQSRQPSSLRKPPPFPRVFPERPWAPQGQEQVTFKVFGLRPEDLAG